MFIFKINYSDFISIACRFGIGSKADRWYEM